MGCSSRDAEQSRNLKLSLDLDHSSRDTIARRQNATTHCSLASRLLVRVEPIAGGVSDAVSREGGVSYGHDD